MNFVIAIEGKSSEKMVRGELKQVIPFVGTDRAGEFASLGIGFISPCKGAGAIWGLVIPHSLIRSWRGMKLLEQVKHIESGTLCACWTIADRDISRSDHKHLNDLAIQFGGLEELEKAREAVLASVPSAEEIESILTILREKNVDINCWELAAEIETGLIASSPLIETLIREQEEKQAMYTQQEERIRKPMQPEESLGKFFLHLGIHNFIIGGGIGGYGMDWGHIKLGELDEIAKRYSLSEYLVDGFILEHTTKGPETFATNIAPGLTVHQTSFGEIERPWYRAANGKKYTFLSAKYRDNHFMIKTLITLGGKVLTEGEYSVSELRSLIGSILITSSFSRLKHLATSVRSAFR